MISGTLICLRQPLSRRKQPRAEVWQEGLFNFRRHLKWWHCHENWSLWWDRKLTLYPYQCLYGSRAVYSKVTSEAAKNREASEDIKKRWNYKDWSSMGSYAAITVVHSWFALYILPSSVCFLMWETAAALEVAKSSDHESLSSWITVCQWKIACESDCACSVVHACAVPVTSGKPVSQVVNGGH